MTAEPLTRVCVPELGREIFLRWGTSDEDALDQALTELCHVPPSSDVPQVVVDMGCYIGITVAHYAHLWPDALVVGLELDPQNAAVARMNVDIRCSVTIGAVGPAGTSLWYDSVGDEWGYALGDRGQHEVLCRSLGQWLDALVGDRAVDLLKLDIEGMEWSVLADPGWESRVKELIVVLHPRADESGLLARRRAMREASRELEGRGYTTSVVSKRRAILFARKGGE